METEKKRTHFKRTYEKVLLKFATKEKRPKQRDENFEMGNPYKLRTGLA